MAIIMIITILEFFASICDERIGGTNMTLLATVINLGTTGSKTGALWLLDFLTFKQCSVNNNKLCSHKNETNVRIYNNKNVNFHIFNSYYIYRYVIHLLKIVTFLLMGSTLKLYCVQFMAYYGIMFLKSQ